MVPSGVTLDHRAAPLLLELASMGCHMDIIREAWTMEMLEEAITKVAHPSAMDPIPVAQLRVETLEKVAQGYTRLVSWAELKQNTPKPPKNLTYCSNSPQKSRLLHDP